MNLIRNNTFDNEIVLVDGHCGSGKSLISKVLECYDRVEKSQEDEPFLITQHMYRLGLIDEDTSVALLRLWADRYLYNLMIGRNINTRHPDVTSLDTHPFKEKYLNRMYSEDHTKAINRIRKEKPIFQNMSQNALIDARLYFRAFGERLKIIYIQRNQSDVIKSIMKSKFGTRIGCDPTEITSCIDYCGCSVPYYAKGWEEEYLHMSAKKRVKTWILQETIQVNMAYNELEDILKKRIMFISFDEFVKNPYHFCERMCNFLNTTAYVSSLYSVLEREKCPR